jgi:pyruvate,water dikinase
MFGAPLSHMEMRWVNGRFYRRLVPLVGGDRDLPTPPAPVLWLVSRLHPAFRREERQARESLTGKRWRDELARWEAEWKPALLATNRAFAAVDPTGLDDAHLADHLVAVHRHLHEHVRLHFRLHVSDMGPLGLLMVHLADWGLPPADTFGALVAASPATRRPAEELRGLAALLAEAGVDPTTVASFDEVRAASAPAAAALDAYLAEHGWRLTTGYDLEDRCLAELPEVLLASIRAAGRAPAELAAAPAGDPLAELRARVPAEHRATFDDAVEDARLSYGLRDENGPLTYEWPAGLLRRALLEAGRRLHDRDRLEGAGDVFELDIGEVVALLRDQPGPDLAEIAARAATRRWEAGLEPPAHLGRADGDPPVDVLPRHLALFTRIVLAVVATIEAGPGRVELEGVGIGTEPYVGTARVVHDATEALSAMEPGDVVVAPYTAPTYNAVLAMAGAIVTEEGGLLCHAAVIARELGLPAVIGAAGAMAIADGATVEVDPAAGTVRVR